jgi:cellulose biosynthesis protein BcsQ
MLISLWSDKGGAAKTTLAIQVAARLRARAIDLDYQRDFLEWAKLADFPCEDFAPPQGQHCSEELLERRAARLIAAAQDDTGIWIADSRPGTDPENLQAMGYSQLVIIPCRTDKRDLRALARSLDEVNEVRASGNPGLLAGVVVAALRDNALDRNASLGLQAVCSSMGEHFLGEMKDRTVYKQTYQAGTHVKDGPGGEEIEAIVQRIRGILPDMPPVAGRAPKSTAMSVAA